MSKSVSAIAVIFLVLAVFSGSVLAKEIRQGTVEISGGFDVSYSSVETEPEGSARVETDTRTVDASVSYYLAPNVGVGVLWNYENSETTGGTFSSEITTNIIGPQLTFNVSLSDKVSFKLKGAVFIASTEFSNSSSAFSSQAETDGLGWAVQGGLSYFVVESVSFNGGITYTSLDIETDSTNVDLDVTGLSVGVGISVYIF